MTQLSPSFLLYLDPGSGSILFQVLISGLLGVAFFFKNIRLMIAAFFARIFKKSSRATTNDGEQTGDNAPNNAHQHRQD